MKLNYFESNDVIIFVVSTNIVSEIKSRDTDEFSRVLYWFLVRLLCHRLKSSADDLSPLIVHLGS